MVYPKPMVYDQLMVKGEAGDTLVCDPRNPISREQRICGLYEIVNILNGTRYIGSSSHIFRRLIGHRGDLRTNEHHNAHLQHAWFKYGEGSFVFRIICRTTEEEKIPTEQRHLDLAFGGGEKLYNISKNADAPRTGVKHTQETKDKISRAHTGKKVSEEVRRRIGDFWRGRKHSEETKRKMSLSAMGKPKSEAHKKRMSEVNMGKTMSAETRLKLSIANKGKPCPTKGTKHSTETRLKMSLAGRGKSHSPEHVAKVTAAGHRARAIKAFMNSGLNVEACLI